MKYIIGAGITGLIFAYYNKDYFVVSDQIGGQMLSHFDLGPRYLHYKSEKVRKFLESLDMPIHISTIKVGYLDDNGWIENPDLDFRQQYYLKSRGTKDIKGFDSSVLNCNIREFQVCDVDFKLLIYRLFQKVSDRIITDRIKKIDLEERLITTFEYSFNYNKLVSTIPLNIFCKISGIDKQLEHTSIAYCLLSPFYFDLKQFDFIYDNRINTYHHRMTKSKQGIVCDVLEQNLDKFKNSVDPEYYVLPIESSIKVVKNSQIISLEKDFRLDDHPEVKFLGRYAAWNRRFKTETIIEEAQ
jgi:hypothetical protein